jgi:Ser/Thr protein kinase RdoA (MazF antagonist)
VQQALAATEAALPDRANVLTTLHDAHDILLPRLQALVPAPPNYGMIHGDVIRTNAIVAPDGTVSVIDFDLCGLGWRAYDVASYLFAIRGTPDEPALRAGFLAGYRDVRPLSQPEQTMLPLFETVRAVFHIGIPARYVNTWGRAYVDAFLDGSISQLNQCLDQLLDG